MKKIKVLMSLVMVVSILSVALCSSFASNAQTFSVQAYEKITSTAQLNDGDLVIFENFNSPQKSWLGMNARTSPYGLPYAPFLDTTDDYTRGFSEFRVKKLSNGRFAFHVPYGYFANAYISVTTYSNGDLSLVGIGSGPVPEECQFDLVLHGDRFRFVSPIRVLIGPTARAPLFLDVTPEGKVRAIPAHIAGSGIFFGIYKIKSAGATITSNKTSWDTGYAMNYTIANPSPSQLTNWAVEVEIHQSNTITVPANCVIESQVAVGDNYRYTITGASWNKSIPANGQVNFSFNVLGNPNNNTVFKIFTIK